MILPIWPDMPQENDQDAVNHVNESIRMGGLLLSERHWGQSRSGTIIRLKDNAAGFTNAGQTKAVIITGSRGYHGNKGYRSGEGNEAFENHLRDFTLDVGKGNAGAVGIDYQVSNVGGMRNISIRASDPTSGAIGIDMRRRDNGPGIIADVLIDGFAVGLRMNQELSQMNGKNLILRGQREVGIDNHDAILTINGLTSENTVPVATNSGSGHLTLVEVTANGGAAEAFTFKNTDDARLLLHNVSVKGYKAVIDQKPNPLVGPKVAAWCSSPIIGGDLAAVAKQWLPQEQPVRYTVPGLKDWSWLPQPSGGDDSDVIQAALRGGKPVIALGAGRWHPSKPLEVPATVRLITSLGAEIDTNSDTWDSKSAAFTLVGGKATDQTIIERISYGGKCPLLIDHLDARTVVMRDLCLFSGLPYRNVSGAKKLFIDSLPGSGYVFGPGTKVWADQMNVEGHGLTVLDKAQLVAYGFKSEGGEAVFKATDSTIQIFGGLVYSFGGVGKDTPIVESIDSQALVSLVNVTYVGNGAFPLAVRTSNKGTVTDVRADQLPRRGGGYAVPLVIDK